MECPHYEWKDGGFLGTDQYYCNLCQNCVSEAKHDYYCRSDSNWSECDIYKRYAQNCCALI